MNQEVPDTVSDLKIKKMKLVCSSIRRVYSQYVIYIIFSYIRNASYVLIYSFGYQYHVVNIKFL